MRLKTKYPKGENRLKKDKNRTWAEIHLDRLERNIKKITSSCTQGCELMAVVKADAYGHGDIQLSQKLSSLGIRYFAVSNIDEAENVRSVCPSSDILILGYTNPEYAKELISNNIIQGILSYENALAFSQAAENSDAPLRCHIKLDTGMGRVGLKFRTPSECADEIIRICELPGLAVEGIYTHFSCADSDVPNDISYTEAQKEFIEKTYEIVRTVLKENAPLHLHYLNSAGLMYLKNTRSTLARAGIILYGLMPNSSLELPIELEPVMELKTVISHIKEIDKGDFISYSRTFCAERKMKIATMPIGYADGYPRALSSKSQVIINGKRCNIIGRICMDQMMCDVSNIENVSCGDTVTLFGIDGDERITADELASLYGSIGYELVCGISKRVPRIFSE